MTEATRPAATESAMALLFSGGLDTTLEVVDRAEQYRRVHLLTFDNGLCINMGGARRRAEEISRALGPDRVVHVELDTRPLLQAALDETRALGGRWQSPLVFDLCCKLSAVTELAVYARNHGITDVSDGAAHEQTEIFLQDMHFLAHVEPFLTDNGLRFSHPVNYDASRDAKLGRLRDLGLSPGVRALEKVFITSQLAHQPFCLRGIVTFFFTSPLRRLGPIRRMALPVDDAVALWKRLLPLAQRHLDTSLRP